jgi:hypothetical protein
MQPAGSHEAGPLARKYLDSRRSIMAKKRKIIKRVDGHSQRYSVGTDRTVPLTEAQTPSAHVITSETAARFDEPAGVPVEYSDIQLKVLAEEFEAAWTDAKAQPTHKIEGFGKGVQPRLSEYAVLFAIGLEDRGYGGAFEMVMNNRPRVEGAWDYGIPPLVLVEDRINPR